MDKGKTQYQYTLKMASIIPEGSSYAKIACQSADYIEEKSGGRLKPVWYFSGVMGDEPDIVRKIRMGQLQGAASSLTGLGIIIPEMNVMTLPFLFNDYDEVDYILKKMTPRFIEISFERGIVLGGWMEVGFVYFFSDKPIKSVEDLSRMKMWLWSGNPILEESLRVVGFKNLIPINFPEVLTSLKTGLIDSFLCTHYVAVATQWYAEARYITKWPIFYTPAGIIIDKKYFDSLPVDLQKILIEANDMYVPKLKEHVRKDNWKTLKGMYMRGMVVTEAEQGLIDELKKIVFPVYKKFSNKLYPDWLLTEIIELLNDYRENKPH